MNISFFLTQKQVKAREKDVTRRNGWKPNKNGKPKVKSGDILQGIVKGQGLKLGEKVDVLCKIRIKDVRQERLDRMTFEPEYGKAEVIREGFPEMSPAEFVAMYCAHNECDPWTEIMRIEFEYLD